MRSNFLIQINKIHENAAFQDVKCHPLKGLALVGDIVLA